MRGHDAAEEHHREIDGSNDHGTDQVVEIIQEDLEKNYPYFTRWLPDKEDYFNNSSVYEKKLERILSCVINCDDLNIKERGIILAGNYRLKGLLPDITAQLDINVVPPHLNFIYSSFTIRQQAQIAINEIKKPSGK